jgi:hypothetical protein
MYPESWSHHYVSRILVTPLCIQNLGHTTMYPSLVGLGLTPALCITPIAALVSQYGPIEINFKTLRLQQDILLLEAVCTFALWPFQVEVLKLQ